MSSSYLTRPGPSCKFGHSDSQDQVSSGRLTSNSDQKSMVLYTLCVFEGVLQALQLRLLRLLHRGPYTANGVTTVSSVVSGAAGFGIPSARFPTHH